MGSSSKKYKEKSERSGRKRHRSRSATPEYSEASREERKRHKHKKHHHHHRERRKERERAAAQHYGYESAGSDVVEISPHHERTPSPPKITKSSTPEPAKTQSSGSLSIDATNKLRAKLGLKPLQVEGETAKADDGRKKDDLGEFYHRPAANLAVKTKTDKIKAKLSEHKEKRSIEHKLNKVKLLGDSDGEDDAVSWVQKNRSIDHAKREADRRAKVLEELDAQFGISEVIDRDRKEKQRQMYNEKHLKGLQVNHDVDSFSEGKTVILTLKDTAILDDEDDVLVNVNMIDDERYKKSNENKKKKIQYNPYDVEEFDEWGNPKPKSLLEKYDEEIDGERRDSFQIGSDAGVERKRIVLQNIKEKLANKFEESLQGPGLKLASEYYNDEEMSKFKKPKKKVRKMRAKGTIASVDSEDVKKTGIENVGTRRPKKEEMHMDIDDVPDIKVDAEDVNLEEKDDILERALHKARKLKQRENATNMINDIVNNIKPEVKEEPIDTGNIILNSTAEFCRTLGDIPTYGRAGNRDETEDMLDFDKDQKIDEDDDDDCQIIEPIGSGTWSAVDPNAKHTYEQAPAEVPILDEEPDVGSGVGAALKLAMSKGYLDKEESNRPSNSRLAYLQAKHYSIEDKNYGDETERGGGRRERYSGPVMDFKEKDLFKPNVKLEYIDDEGHVLNSKEAFRYLSHKFHGKGPGKNKIEKRIKKTVQEGLMKKMSSTDTPLGTLNMLQAKQKEIQSPYIVLSGGKTHSTSISKARR